MYELLTKPTDPALVITNMECIAVALRYPDIMFPKQKATSAAGYICGALRLGKDVSNIRHAISELTAEEYNKRVLTVENDVQSSIIDFSKPLNGLQGKGDALRSREVDFATKLFKNATSAGLGPTTLVNLTTTLNNLYNETTTNTGGTNLYGLTLPPFVFLLVDGDHLNTQLDFQYTGANVRGFKNNVKIPGYICLGDVFVLDNQTAPSPLGAEMYSVTSPVLLMFARQELCLVGVGTSVDDSGLYMLKPNNPLYRAVGVFTSTENNVAVLKCAFKETSVSQPEFQFSAFTTQRLYMQCNNANYKVFAGSDIGVECCRSYKEMMENFITTGIDVLNKQQNNLTLGGQNLFPGGVADIRTFFTALCDKNPTINGYYNLCDCIKPRNATLDTFRNAVGLNAKPNQIVSFACNTKGCINRNKKTVVHFGDPCPATKPRLCIDDIKSINAPNSVLTNVCYNCNDLTSACIENAPVSAETVVSSPCGLRFDGTEILCGSSEMLNMPPELQSNLLHKTKGMAKTRNASVMVIGVIVFVVVLLIIAIIYFKC